MQRIFGPPLVSPLRSMLARQAVIRDVARNAQRDLNTGSGSALIVYDALKPYMRSFHISATQFAELADPTNLHIDDAIKTIWPFDAFEIVIDGGFQQELQTDVPGISRSYHLTKFAIAQWSYLPHLLEGIVDHEWMILDSSTYSDGHVEVDYVSFMRGQPDGEYRFMDWPPYGQTHPNYKAWEQRMGNPNWPEQDKPYWTKLFLVCKRLADLLQHSSVGADLIPDPDRPPTRQQRRSSGYIETDHYRIKLRPRAKIAKALDDVSKGRSLHTWARRRHKVVGHLRRYKTGKIVPVIEHVRGGKYGAGPQYDVSNFPLKGTNPGQRTNNMRSDGE